MRQKMKQKTKLIIILAAEFIAISIVLLLIFFAGKKSYTVTFDLNGGILLSGDTEQRVTQGQNATPPSTAKDGHYLLGWAGNYRKVTHDSTVRAIWEYETTPGIVYSDSENQNYCEIVGSFKELRGEIYIGAYHDEKIVLGITDGAFKDRKGITAIHLLDGILSIGEEAFAGCEKLETIDLPSTVVTIGKDAFKDCKNLKSITLPEGLETIEAGAFAGCESLEEITLPWTVTKMGVGVFDTQDLVVYIHTVKPVYEEKPNDEDKKDDEEQPDDNDEDPVEEEPERNYAEGWHGDGVIIQYIKVVNGDIIPDDTDSGDADGDSYDGSDVGDTDDGDSASRSRR